MLHRLLTAFGLALAAVLIAIGMLALIIGMSDWPNDPPCEPWGMTPCQEIQE